MSKKLIDTNLYVGTTYRNHKISNLVCLVTKCSSYIWTERYWLCGDFEIVYPASETVFNNFQIGYFVGNPESTYAMMIEQIELKTDEENGDTIVISGRSTEAILDFGVINGNLSLSSSAIAAALSSITSLTTTVSSSLMPTSLTVQYAGDNIYTVVTDLCKQYNSGLRIISGSGGGFNIALEIYAGADKTATVVFSHKLGNLLTSDYVVNHQTYRNVALVKGDTVDDSTFYAWAGTNTKYAWNCRELLVDGSSLSRSGLTTDVYTSQLQAYGLQNLAGDTTTFTGTVDNAAYKYRTDYNVGDKVLVQNEYGISATPRIIEVIESMDGNGATTVASFSWTEEE